MRDQMPHLVWQTWRFMVIFKVAVTLNRKYSLDCMEIIKFVRVLLIDSSRLTVVSKSYFQKVLKSGVGFGDE